MITRIVTRYLHLELYIEPYDINSLVYLCQRFSILCFKLEVSASSRVPWLWFCALHFLKTCFLALHVSQCFALDHQTSWRKHYFYQCHRMCHVVIFHCTRHRCKLLTEGRISTWFLCSPSLPAVFQSKMEHPFWLPTGVVQRICRWSILLKVSGVIHHPIKSFKHKDAWRRPWQPLDSGRPWQFGNARALHSTA